MKAAIYVTKKATEGLQDQVGQAYALIDQRGWEMVRMVHQDELADDAKLESFYQAVQAGEFQMLAVPSTDVSWSAITGKPTVFPTNWSLVSGKPTISTAVPSNGTGSDGDAWWRYQ